MSIFNKKNSIAFLTCLIIFLNLIIPFGALAATPTIAVTLKTEDVSATNNEYRWGFDIQTTAVQDSGLVKIALYKKTGNTLTFIQQNNVTVKSNDANYVTDNILDSCTFYKVVFATGDLTNIIITTYLKQTPGTSCTPAPAVVNNNAPVITPANNVNTPTTVTSTNTTYTPLAPLPGEQTTIDTTTGFGAYLNTLIKIFIGICAVLAMIMIVMGGLEYMTSELVSGKAAGRERLTNAIFGLILALSAFAILNTLNPELLNIGLNNLPKATITIQPLPDISQSTPANGQTYANTNCTNGAAWPSDTATRTELLTIPNVSILQGPCTTVGSTGCTSVYGLDESFVRALHNDCSNCQIVITEGTAFWAHAANNLNAHYPGGFTVDLQETPTLQKELSTWTKVHFPVWFQNAGADCYSKNGMGIVDEGNHYHVFSLTGNCTTQQGSTSGTTGSVTACTNTGSVTISTTDNISVTYNSASKKLYLVINDFDINSNYTYKLLVGAGKKYGTQIGTTGKILNKNTWVDATLLYKNYKNTPILWAIYKDGTGVGSGSITPN